MDTKETWRRGIPEPENQVAYLRWTNRGGEREIMQDVRELVFEPFHLDMGAERLWRGRSSRRRR